MFLFLHGRSPSFSPIPICLYSNKYLIFAIKLTKIHFISSYYSNINSHTWALITESWDIGYGVFCVNNLLARQTMWEKSTFLVENLQGLCWYLKHDIHRYILCTKLFIWHRLRNLENKTEHFVNVIHFSCIFIHFQYSECKWIDLENSDNTFETLLALI